MSASAPAVLAVGTVLADTYELVRLVGRGGMGTVWEAKHRRLPSKHLAIKVLSSAAEADAEAQARFRREAEIASRLGHPHIVQVSDFNVLPSGEPYLVMDLLFGESLGARLKRGPLPLAEALAITVQVGSALAAAHRAGVVHRDLKPDNIFLCTPAPGETGPDVKLLDFGISKLAGATTALTADAKVLGTPRYMSPEQARGEQDAIDARTDVFALGAIVYEMLSGRAAFPGETVPEIVFKVVFQPHLSLTDAPPHVIAAVDTALAKTPAARYPSALQFVQALTGGVGSGATGTGGHVLAAPPHPRRRNRAILVVGAGLAMAFAAVMTVIAAKSIRSGDALPKYLPDAAVADAGPSRIIDAAPFAADAAAIDAAGSPQGDRAQPGGDDPRKPLAVPTPNVAAAKLLLDAHAAASGDPEGAMRIARRSLAEAGTPSQKSEAHVIILRVACRSHDIATAQAELTQLAPALQRDLIRECASNGLVISR